MVMRVELSRKSTLLVERPGYSFLKMKLGGIEGERVHLVFDAREKNMVLVVVYKSICF